MNFKISQSVFHEALQKVVGVVPPKTTIPILTCILFELEDDKLHLTGTDLEISVTLSLDVTDAEAGSAAVPARLLIEIIRELPDVPLHIYSVDSDRIVIETEKGEYKIATQDVEDFPRISVEESEFSFAIDSEILARMATKTTFAVSTDELRPALTGILMELFPREIRFVGTDGHRLSRIVYQKVELPQEVQHKLIIPTKSLNLVLKNLGAKHNVQVNVGEDHIVFSLDNSVIYSKLISGSYPNYERVIPTDNDKILQVNRELLLSTLRRVSIFSSSMTHQVRFVLTPQEMLIHSEDIEFGAEAKETIPCQFSADWMQVGYNSAYLMDILRHIDTDEVIFSLKDSVTAAVIYPPEQQMGENLTMLLMPIRLTEEEPESEEAPEETGETEAYGEPQEYGVEDNE